MTTAPPMTAEEFRSFGRGLLGEARELRLQLPADQKAPQLLALVQASGNYQIVTTSDGVPLQNEVAHIERLIREFDVVAAVVVSEVTYRAYDTDNPLAPPQMAGEALQLTWFWPAAGVRESRLFDIVRTGAGVDLVANEAGLLPNARVPWLKALEAST
ncbi:hypothetical protein ACIGXM_14535 [Kitasatospora sp. NPDC052896]|uniref:hypothetical protein n=1 Tax=Kitasatospora sp. NPDC052896 TaxID=3364061 RepID=UPI0037CA37D3